MERFCRYCAFVLVGFAVTTIVLLILILRPDDEGDYDYLPIVAESAWDAIGNPDSTSPVDGWYYFQRTADNPSVIQMDSTAPESSGNVLAIDFTGVNQDSEPGVWWHSIPNSREIYSEWWVKFSSNWTCSSAGCGKISFYFPPSGGDLYMGIYCDTPQTQWPGSPAGGCTNPNPEYFIIGGQLQWGEYGGWPLIANKTKTQIVRNRWYKMAHYLKYSSTPTTKDGVWRIYVDDTLNLERTDIAVSIDPVIEFQYGPSRQAPPPPNEFMYIDHTRVRALIPDGPTRTKKGK